MIMALLRSTTSLYACQVAGVRWVAVLASAAFLLTELSYANAYCTLDSAAENDAACCPSQKRRAFYAIQVASLSKPMGKRNESTRRG